VVCDFCKFAVDHRFLPGMDSKKIIEQFKSIIRSEAKKFKMIVTDLQQPYEFDRGHPFVQTYVKTAKKLKCKATLKGCEGATVITFFQNYKIPAFATGFGAHRTAHTTDEYIYLKSLFKGTRLLEEYIKEYDRL